MTNVLGLDPIPGRHSWEKSLGEFLEIVTGANPGKTFVEMDGYHITYGEFMARCRSAATMFRRLGVQHGDRVCIFLPNVPEVLYTWFGLSLIGGITVTINTAYRRDEMAFILNNAEASTLVAHESLIDVATQAADIAPCIQHRLFVGAGDVPDGWQAYSDLLAGSPELEELPSVSPTDIAVLQYTSGTTGNPKGVMVTHQMYVSAGQGFARWTQATPDDRFFTCLPYFHANAQYYSTMGTLASGATLVVQDRFSASRFWQQVRDARATVVNFIGMMMPVLAKNDPSADDADNPVRLFYGSPAFSPEFLAEFEQRFGTDIIVGFGMTETCYGTIEDIRGERRPNSSGLPRQHPDPSFGNTVRIVDDAGVPVPNGQPGEITIQNPATMPGYWRNAEQTAESLRDGWLFTGDLGGWTTTTFCTSWTAKRTSSAAGEKIFPPRKWKTSSNVTKACWTAPSSRCLPSLARMRLRPTSPHGPAHPSPRKKSFTGAPNTWPTSKCPVTLKSEMSFPELPACASARMCCARSGTT